MEYDSPELALMQKTVAKSTISAFSSKELIGELQNAGMLAARGDADELLKIKKLVATP